MRRIHVICDDGEMRELLSTLLESQAFEVTIGRHSDQVPPSDVTVFDGRNLIDEAQLREAARRAAQEGPTLAIIPLPVRRGTETWMDDVPESALDARQRALRDVGIDAFAYETSDERFLVAAIRALLHQSAPKQVHVLEDDDDMAQRLASALTIAGYDVDVSGNFEDARAAFQESPIDVLIIDRQLPHGADGLDFIRELRARRIYTAAIVLSVLDNEEDRIEGIKAGADDYLGKSDPRDYSERMLEVVARIEAALLPRDRTRDLIFGPLEISLSDHITRWRGERVHDIKGRDQQLLEYLAERQNISLPLEMIMADIWGRVFLPTTELDATERHGPLVARRAALKRTFAKHGVPDPIVGNDGTYCFDPKIVLALDKEA